MTHYFLQRTTINFFNLLIAIVNLKSVPSLDQLKWRGTLAHSTTHIVWWLEHPPRILITRLNEHRICEESEVFRHLLENPEHTVGFKSPKILDKSNNINKLRIKETLHIFKLQPDLNVDYISLPLNLFNA